VRHILALHDHSELSIHSKGPHQGTTFEMRLNLLRAVDRSSNASSNANAYTMTRTASQSARLNRSAPWAQAPEVTPALGSRASYSPSTAMASPGPAHPLAIADAEVEGMSVSGRQSVTIKEVLDSVPTLAPEDRSASQIRPSDADDHASHEGSGRCRVLHVEDDLMLQMTFAARLFTRLGVPYDTASNGKEGLDLVVQRQQEGEPYTLVIMDNQMPVMGGTEAGRRMREAGFTKVIIGITGDPEGSPERDGFQDAGGLDECVDKSLTGMQIIEDYIRMQLCMSGLDDSPE